MNVRQHCENLTRLADRLRSLGVDERTIDTHVLEIFGEYERELIASIQDMQAA